MITPLPLAYRRRRTYVPQVKTRYVQCSWLLVLLVAPACGSSDSLRTDFTPTNRGDVVTFGDAFTGGFFHLGPVDYEETQYHNACAPGTKYPSKIRQIEGDMLTALWDGIPKVAYYCDSCIWVETEKGRSALLRVVSYGDTTRNSIDVSPNAYDLLNTGENPRNMQWWFSKCPDTGPLLYEFKPESSQWWAAFWIRDTRIAIAKVEISGPNHKDFVTLRRETDGSSVDDSGFGKGDFTIRLTSIDGQQLSDTFTWPDSGIGGVTLTGQGNFQ